MSQMTFFIQRWATDKNFQIFLCFNQKSTPSILLIGHTEGDKKFKYRMPYIFYEIFLTLPAFLLSYLFRVFTIMQTSSLLLQIRPILIQSRISLDFSLFQTN